jgi:hypothetical protein
MLQMQMAILPKSPFLTHPPPMRLTRDGQEFSREEEESKRKKKQSNDTQVLAQPSYPPDEEDTHGASQHRPHTQKKNTENPRKTSLDLSFTSVSPHSPLSSSISFSSISLAT